MLTIQSQFDHKRKYKCRQYSYYVIINVDTHAKIHFLCDHKRKHKC